jgi:hypothetical protein
VANWKGFAVIMSWEGEKGLGWRAGRVGGHHELGGEQRTGLDLFHAGDRHHLVSDKFIIKKV